MVNFTIWVLMTTSCLSCGITNGSGREFSTSANCEAAKRDFLSGATNVGLTTAKAFCTKQMVIHRKTDPNVSRQEEIRE